MFGFERFCFVLEIFVLFWLYERTERGLDAAIYCRAQNCPPARARTVVAGRGRPALHAGRGADSVGLL